MPAVRLALGCLLVLTLAIGGGHASALIAVAGSGVTGDAERLDPRRTSVAGDGADGVAPAIPRLQSSTADCSAALMALLPPPEDLEPVEQSGYENWEVTGRGCRTLTELAATFADPEQAALDLSMWGWVETAYQSYSGGGGTRISIQRFETPEGAAQALDAFASTANEPAGTSEVDPAHLQPNQRALQSRSYWGALFEQDGVLLTRVSFGICCADAPGPPLNRLLAVREALHASWVARDPSTPTLSGLPETVSDPEADSTIAKRCLGDGTLACAEEYFEAAYASARDAQTQADLYAYYVLSGDVWQENEDLDRARQAYQAAVRLAPSRSEAVDRLHRVRGYAAVELFDPFTEFYSARGCDPHAALMVDALSCGRVLKPPVGKSPDGQLIMTPMKPGWDTVYWAHTPTSANYAVTTALKPVILAPDQRGVLDVVRVFPPPPVAIGLNLAHSETDSGVTFLVDTGTQKWWVATQNGDGTWTELIPRASYADRIDDPITWLEVRVRDGTPTFLVNETEVAEAMDLSWLDIPRTGDAGVVLAASAAPATEPPSALLESFGIYALKGDEAGGGQTEQRLVSLLPTQDELPAELVLIEEGAREAEEITATFPDPADAAQRFTEWGWQETVYRDFASPDGTTSVSISLHRFADAQSAAEALPYLADARAVALGLEPVAVAEIGDQVEAVEGQVADGHEVSLYVRDGPVVARVTAVSSTDDPLALAAATAESMLSTE